MKQPKINIITLGCSKNIVDSEKLIYQLKKSGYSVENDKENSGSNIVIINTCGFINDAKEENINTILKYIEKKKEGKINKLYVTGCLSERYSSELIKEMPEVDKYFGVNSMASILKEFSVDMDPGLLNHRTLTNPGHFAYLKVSEGCDRNCAFCAIPGIKGKCISNNIENLMEEASVLGNKGIKELILIAQDLSYYGTDLYKKQMLPELVSDLVSLNNFEWIRLHYLYPSKFPWELVDLINENPSICRYIDLPIQHITDNMLTSMRRTHKRINTEDILYRLRDEIPDVAIRTTLISGFPGETEKDHQELLEFVNKFKFDRLGVFPYSHEDGTWAYNNLCDNIPHHIKQKRVDEIMELQQNISATLNKSKEGRIIKTLIDRKEGGMFVGRTEYDSPEVDHEVLIPISCNLKIGNFYDIKIEKSTEFDLYGTAVS